MTSTLSTRWRLHPGDYLIMEVQGSEVVVVARSANDLEAQRLLHEFHAAGKLVYVFQFKGQIP